MGLSSGRAVGSHMAAQKPSDPVTGEAAGLHVFVSNILSSFQKGSLAKECPFGIPLNSVCSNAHHFRHKQKTLDTVFSKTHYFRHKQHNLENGLWKTQ